MITGLHHVSMKCGSPEALLRVKTFYVDLLGFQTVREWPEGLMLRCGSALLEIFTNGEGSREKGALRHIALAADDVDAIAARVQAAGYEVFLGPKELLIPSEPPLSARIAFCRGPLGEEIEFFRER